MNDALTKAVSPAEVKANVFAIYSEKAPWPDGMTALFYQKVWHIFGPQVVSMVQEFIDSGGIDSSINEVNLCLIPRNEQPRRMREFWPTILCNASYKIISKVLCQQLKILFPNLVSETQLAFVAGRVI